MLDNDKRTKLYYNFKPSSKSIDQQSTIINDISYEIAK